MTTETQQIPHQSGFKMLLGAAAITLVIGMSGTLLAAIVSGSSAAAGALVGSLLALLVFSLGSFVVNSVAGLMPTAALLVALMTYTLQVLLMALVFVGLSGSGLLDATLDRTWLASMIMATTFVWLGAQLLLTTRQRILIYDLPEAERAGAVEGVVEVVER